MNLIEQSKLLLSQKIFPRNKYFDQLDKLLESEQIIVVQWQRRSGKSYTIMWYFQYKNINLEEVFFLNKELDIEWVISDVNDLNNLFIDYQNNIWDPKFIVIDEIQDINNWENFIRAKFTEKKYKIIISWSNSKLLSWDLSTYLSGRYITFSVYPFEYREYLDYTKENNTPNNLISYLQWWWMPEIVNIKDTNIKYHHLQDILDSTVLKDIISRFQIRDINYFNKVMRYIADNIWTPLSLRNIQNSSKNFWWGTASVEKISSYLDFLQVPFLIHGIWNYDIKWKKILERNEKYYFNDLWIRNTLKFSFDDDKWKLLENIVFLQLKRLWYEIFVWNFWDTEIDFVCKRAGEISYFQVSYNILDETTKQREFWNLLKIDDAHPKYVISADQLATDYKWIKHMYISDFLLNFK